MSTKSQKKFRTPYGGRDAQQTEGITFTEPSLTKQSFKDDCDINTILRRYNEQGRLPDLIKTNPRYGDFSSSLEFQESLNIVIHAQEQFDALSSQVRDRFGNDPARFLDFVNNPANAEELIQLGLASQKEKAPLSGNTDVKHDPVKEGSEPKK